MSTLILNFGDGEVTLEVPAAGDITIGSARNADIFIDHPDVELRHAKISVDQHGACWISDLESKQGTFINGRRIKLQKLAPGDDMMFGLVVVQFVALRPGSIHSQDGAMAISTAQRAESALVQPEKHLEPLLRPGTSSNLSRSSYFLRLFILLALVNAALFLACAIWFYSKTRNDFEKRFDSLAAKSQPAAPQAPAVPLPMVPDINVTKLTKDTDDLKKQNAALQSTLNDLQKKLSASEDGARETSKQLTGLATLVDEVKKAAAKKDVIPAAQAAGDGNSSMSQSELVLLKERNRLTAFADEAIATGERDPYDRLWDSIEDPRLAHLVHAARAEILRVQDCYINGQRVKFYGVQQHQIPVGDIFPDSAALAPDQLSDDQLIQVLQDLKQSWQTRVKAAWHLGQRRSTKVGDALVKAIKSDPSLDVAAEATLSFEQITGYHAKLFDAQRIEVWWKSYNEKPPVNKSTTKFSHEAGADSKAKAE